jgi:hypothetical protein
MAGFYVCSAETSGFIEENEFLKMNFFKQGNAGMNN